MGYFVGSLMSGEFEKRRKTEESWVLNTERVTGWKIRNV